MKENVGKRDEKEEGDEIKRRRKRWRRRKRRRRNLTQKLPGLHEIRRATKGDANSGFHALVNDGFCAIHYYEVLYTVFY